MRHLLVGALLVACGGGDARKAPPDASASVPAGDVGPVTAVGAERVGGVVLARVDDTRAVVSSQALVDLAVEAAGYDGAMTTRGARLGAVPPGSIAAQLGLAPGDVIAEVAGTKVRQADDLQAGWLALRRDGVLAVIVDRDGARSERRLFLADLLDDPRALGAPTPDPDPVIADLTAALATGVRPGDPGEIDPRVLEVLALDGLVADSTRNTYRGTTGVSPVAGSPITALGLTTWDSITAIDGREMYNGLSVSNALATPRSELALSVTRVLDPMVLRFRVVPGLVDEAKLAPALEAYTRREAEVEALRAASAAASAGPATDWDPYVKKIDDTHFELDRKVIDLVVADPTTASRGARVVPAIKNAKPDGLKLYAIRPSSLYAKLGLSNGDTIHRVNGHELRSIDDLATLSASVRTAKAIRLELTRRGKPVRLQYDIK